MKELMKGPNERGREDSENAISDDLETSNSMVAFVQLPPPPLGLSSLQRVCFGKHFA
jgi:hypothetical protein